MVVLDSPVMHKVLHLRRPSGIYSWEEAGSVKLKSIVCKVDDGSSASSTRPFGSAVLDGVDLDIEGGGGTGYAAFVTEIRSLASGASKQ